ncbi:DUF3502 domain-containing protein [Paenibacillus sedimenti]|uniref:Extracellular solute-binding protein n=1 Tax=Paenibacillus sedimenti TaxID=2770274 RepID=A0A926QKV0_9BACL|nr:DUF3502 domain-containing protein [Paenibacillus sedimenti]MBD0382960.1 extracellular solute-binding protein [Paenibacillus sedimenti]
MKKKLRVMTLLAVTTSLAVSMAACSSKDKTAGSSAAPGTTEPAASTAAKKLDPVTLKVMLFGNKPADMDKILAEFEKRTKDTLNIKLDIEFNPAADHKQKTKLKLAAGESIDLMFDAPWMNLNTHSTQGLYQELDKYFNNDQYPALKKAFAPEFLEANKINGHIYGIPLTNAFDDIPVVYIRKDLREKFGMKPIQSYEDLQVYLDKVKEKEPNMIPFAGKNDRGFFDMFGLEEKQTTTRLAPNRFLSSTIQGTGAYFNIALSQDGKKVLGATTLGDPAADFAQFPAPFNNPDHIYASFDKRVEWNKYLQKDVLNEKDPGVLFQSGKAAAGEGTINGFAEGNTKLKKAVPNAEQEFFVYNSKKRNMEKGGIGTEYKAWNDLVIPTTSKNADRTMKFLEWLFGTQENHDLFELGIEGTHWTKSGDKMYKQTANTTNYIFPVYELTWNPAMSRINAENSPEALKYIEYQSKSDSYYKLPLAGFTFNSEPVKNEIAKIQPKWATLEPILLSGLDKNWKPSAEKMNKELRDLGLEKVRAELIKQAQEFLDKQAK